MAFTRILGTAVRHPLASAALVTGVAKGTLVVVRRLARGEVPIKATDLPAERATPRDAAPAEPAAPAAPAAPQPRGGDRVVPEPVVIHADPDPEPTPDYTGHVELEEELVWTSESTPVDSE